MGKIYVGLSKYAKAFDCFKQALNIYCAINDKNGIEDFGNHLGCVQVNLGEYSKAIDCFKNL